jgi:hypothetical protein
MRPAWRASEIREKFASESNERSAAIIVAEKDVNPVSNAMEKWEATPIITRNGLHRPFHIRNPKLN